MVTQGLEGAMHGLSGHEELVDPPVPRRPLPFSRAWLAAFVLAVIGIGWTAALDRFDDQAMAADVAALARVVGTIEAAPLEGGRLMVEQQLVELGLLVESPATNGDPQVEQAWSRVAAAAQRSQSVDASDVQAVRLMAADLRAALNDLEALLSR
jgi:hypothetical protein